MDKIEYDVYKTIITHTHKSGKPLLKRTTWLGTVVEDIVKATEIENFGIGDTISIIMTKNNNEDF